MSDLNLEKYYSRSGKHFRKLNYISGSVIQVLEFLKGKPFNDIAYAWISALRPTYLRVTQGEVTLDSRPWRITVFIDKDNIIQEIEQEVEVCLPEGIENGYDLEIKTYGVYTIS